MELIVIELFEGRSQPAALAWPCRMMSQSRHLHAALASAFFYPICTSFNSRYSEIIRRELKLMHRTSPEAGRGPLTPSRPSAGSTLKTGFPTRAEDLKCLNEVHRQSAPGGSRSSS